MYWKEILQVYEDMGVEDIIPIAHTRVKPNIKVWMKAEISSVQC